MVSLVISEIVQLVRNTPIYPSLVFRPIVEDTKETCCDINNLMVRCWAESADDRPDFSTIKSIIRKINKYVHKKQSYCTSTKYSYVLVCGI